MCGLVERRMRRSTGRTACGASGLAHARARWVGAWAHPGQMPMVVLLNGIFRRARRVWKLPVNPVAEIERLTTPKRSGIEFYSPEEVHALVRCASSAQDRVLFLTVALTGLGGVGATWTARLCADASSAPAMPPGCGRCAFTTCATRSAASRSARSIRGSCRSGWATRTSPPRRSTCTTGLARMQLGDCRRRLARTRPIRRTRRSRREWNRRDDPRGS